MGANFMGYSVSAVLSSDKILRIGIKYTSGHSYVNIILQEKNIKIWVN